MLDTIGHHGKKRVRRGVVFGVLLISIYIGISLISDTLPDCGSNSFSKFSKTNLRGLSNIMAEEM